MRLWLWVLKMEVENLSMFMQYFLKYLFVFCYQQQLANEDTLAHFPVQHLVSSHTGITQKWNWKDCDKKVFPEHDRLWIEGWVILLAIGVIQSVESFTAMSHTPALLIYSKPLCDPHDFPRALSGFCWDHWISSGLFPN